MASIESVTTPLAIRFGDGSEKIVAHCFPHSLGLVYLDLFWHQSSPADAAHLIRGELSGEGPWKIGDAVIRTLGCPNTDSQLYPLFLPWKEYLDQQGDEYPGIDQIREIAVKLGASIATT